jgi:hypothetical protein
MRPELALAIARARQQDLRQSTGPHVRSNPRLLVKPASGLEPETA